VGFFLRRWRKDFPVTDKFYQILGGSLSMIGVMGRATRWMVNGLFFILPLGLCRPSGAATLSITIQFIATRHLSSFPPRMRVRILNQGILPVDLSQLAESSELVIDGTPYKRRTAAFEGPSGLAPLGEWQGCLWLEYYVPGMAPGKHQVALKIGDAASPAATVEWTTPINWRKGNMASRRAELHVVAESLEKGLPRSCVEEWLTVQDGGVQESDCIRYYLEPGFKLVVPYTTAKDSGAESQVVNGPVKVYQEMRLRD
jgi:hypothetical protein